ncbi:hybrid sensor histidine kinase/response regulator [Shimia marina]|uniref:histidine kinase n=1 Tax=Shimia marina TaxID=321267 RepID=A0A0P1EQY9_9RHOB|nr:PAS-domain containing protein [Shimia marina]CUH52647.1 Blue-light-activated protein [Shimia marina]SFE67949.1 Signal transduction histidine kinase [Shimia marina]
MERVTGGTQAMTVAGLNLIKQAMSIYDSDLKLVVSNARFREMFSIPKPLTQPGAPFAETIRFLVENGEYGHIRDEDKEAFILERVDRAKNFEPHYFERQRADGRWVSVEGSPMPQGGWVAVYTDITSTKRQEALLRSRSEELSDQLLQYAEELSATNRELESTVHALEEVKRQLTESEARMRLTAEMMPAHIAHVGPDRLYTYSNRRLSAVIPGRPSDIVGMHASEALGDSAYRAIKPHLDGAFKGKPSVFEFNEHPSTRRIRVAFTPDDNAGPERGVYVLSMDITEETQTRVALQQTRRREIAAQMTSGLAHDFSNLLTIILGTQTKLQKMALPEEASALIEATLGAARRGGTLLDNLANVTGPRVPQLAATDMRAFLADLETLAQPTVGDGVALIIENDIPAEALMIDPAMLQDSLVNLLLNAAHACGQVKGAGGTILLIAELVQNTWVQFTVRDTGPGFSEEALNRALDPFFTTKGADGSGLGLAMVYDMTKLVGGDIKIANTATGGQVTLRLPLRRAVQDATPGLALLVEDNPDLRGLIRDMLTSMKHTVIEAASVDEARVLLDQVPDINLVLSDISLEGDETGVDLIRALGRDRVPSYLMTSLPQSHPLYIEGAARAPVLPKPFTAEQLDQFLHPK